MLAGSTGLRSSELFALRWSDVSFITMEVAVTQSIVRNHFGDTKREASRKPVPLHDSVCDVLAEWRAVEISGNDILVSSAKDTFAAEGRIYRRPVKLDGSLVGVEGGIPASIQGIVDTGCIAANGSPIAVADRAGNLYGSDDFARTWSSRRTGLPTPSGVLIC